MTADDAWAAASRAAGVPVEGALRAALERFLDAVDEENRTQNLTAITDRETAIIDHVVDSLALAGVAEAAGRPFRAGLVCVDIGSGGGFPAIPLALVFPETRWVLTESERRKARWLEAVVAAAGLAHVEVFTGRARELRWRRHDLERAVDLVTARAVADLGTLAREARGLLGPGGRLLCPKGESLADPERALGLREAGKSRIEAVGEFPMAVPGRSGVCVVYGAP